MTTNFSILAMGESWNDSASTSSMTSIPVPRRLVMPAPATRGSGSCAEQTTRELASREGIFAGISSGGAVAASLKLSQELKDAVIVSIICDRGDRYLSTGIFPD